jgi:hypothetical protein
VKKPENTGEKEAMDKRNMYGVTFHLHLRRGGLLVGCTLAMVIHLGAGAERVTRGSRRAGYSWGGFLAEFNALWDSVRKV